VRPERPISEDEEEETTEDDDDDEEEEEDFFWLISTEWVWGGSDWETDWLGLFESEEEERPERPLSEE
jgi:hypothetical protein